MADLPAEVDYPASAWDVDAHDYGSWDITEALTALEELTPPARSEPSRSEDLVGEEGLEPSTSRI